MSSKSSVTKVLYFVVYKYISVFTYVTNLLLNPVIMVLDTFCPSLGEGLEGIKGPVKNFLATFPFFALIVFFGAIIFGNENNVYQNVYELIYINDIPMLGFILVSCLGVIYGLSNVKNDSVKSRIKISTIICLSAVPLLVLNPPQLHVYMVTLVYSIGAYTTSLIQFESDVDKITELIDENTGFVNYIYVVAYIAVIFSLILSINFVGLFDSINPFAFTNPIVLILTIILGIAAYGFTKLQQHTYKQIYKHSHPTTSSRFYLFPSRIAIVYATTSVIVAQSVTVVSGLLFFIPAIMYVKFSRYIGRKKEMQIGDDQYAFAYEHNMNSKNRNDTQSGRKPTVNELEYGHTLSDDGNATLDISVSIEIPSEQPDLYNPWRCFLQTTDNVNDIISDLQTVDNNDAEKIKAYDEFYTRASKIGAEKMVNSVNGHVEFPFEDWSEKLSNNVIRQMYQIEGVTMDDIVNANIQISEKEEDIINPNKFTDKFD